MNGIQPTATPAVAARPVAGSPDQRADLFMHHVAAIRPLQAVHTEKKAAATAAAETVAAALNTATADLGVTKDWLLRRIAMASRSQRDLLEELTLERWANGVQGLPDQIDAFGGDETPQAARDGLYYNAQGYQDGLNGLPSNPPEGMHSMFFNDYDTGWGNGQAALMQHLQRGKEIVEAQAQPSTAPAVDLSDEGGEPDTDLDAEAKRLATDPDFMGDKLGARSKGGGVVTPLGVARKTQGQAH